MEALREKHDIRGRDSAHFLLPPPAGFCEVEAHGKRTFSPVFFNVLRRAGCRLSGGRRARRATGISWQKRESLLVALAWCAFAGGECRLEHTAAKITAESAACGAFSRYVDAMLQRAIASVVSPHRTTRGTAGNPANNSRLLNHSPCGVRHLDRVRRRGDRHSLRDGLIAD